MAHDGTDNADGMGAQPQVQLRYVGERFDGARLPLDVLGDLPAFRDLLAAFAKAAYLGVNTDRRRVPRGFEKSLSFNLTGVADGSAIPQLQWDKVTAQSLLPGFVDEIGELIDGSLKKIVTLIDQAANGHFPKVLPPEHVRALNRFGSGLRDGERIEFLGSHGIDGNVVYLDNDRRKALITKVRETYQTRYEGTGTLVGTNAANDPYIQIETKAHGLILINLERDRVIQEFDGNLGTPIQFDVEIELDNTDHFRSLVDVHAVGLIDEQIAGELQRCRNRLDEISKLADGWDNDASHAVSKAAFVSANQFLSRRPQLCGSYKIFPTADGGLLFEFETGRWDLSLECLPSGEVEFFGIEIDGEGEISPEIYSEVSEVLIAKLDKHAGNDGQ